jgi:hypothetical protein
MMHACAKRAASEKEEEEELLYIVQGKKIMSRDVKLREIVSVLLTIILLKPIFLVYVVRVLDFKSTSDSSIMQTDFDLKNLSPHFGSLLVFVKSLFEYSFPSAVISLSTVSSLRTCDEYGLG